MARGGAAVASSAVPSTPTSCAPPTSAQSAILRKAAKAGRDSQAPSRAVERASISRLRVAGERRRGALGVLSTTLPVKPSVTMTSTASANRSLPST
jgi:hypothetical protein